MASSSTWTTSSRRKDEVRANPQHESTGSAPTTQPPSAAVGRHRARRRDPDNEGVVQAGAAGAERLLRHPADRLLGDPNQTWSPSGSSSTPNQKVPFGFRVESCGQGLRPAGPVLARPRSRSTGSLVRPRADHLFITANPNHRGSRAVRPATARSGGRRPYPARLAIQPSGCAPRQPPRPRPSLEFGARQAGPPNDRFQRARP